MFIDSYKDREVNEKLYENRIDELKLSARNMEDKYQAKVVRWWLY